MDARTAASSSESSMCIEICRVEADCEPSFRLDLEDGKIFRQPAAGDLADTFGHHVRLRQAAASIVAVQLRVVIGKFHGQVI